MMSPCPVFIFLCHSQYLSIFFNMPTKMGTCCREKAVLVTVYVERPRRRRVSSKQQQHHHHHHHHHILRQSIRQEVNHQQKGYNRRADLLHYSQSLRESARSAAASTPSHTHPKPISSNNQQPTNQIVPVRHKQRYARTPTCLGNWRVLIPNFLRSMTSLQAKKERTKKKNKNDGSTSKKLRVVVKNLEVQKKWGSVLKMFATLRKRR